MCDEYHTGMESDSQRPPGFCFIMVLRLSFKLDMQNTRWKVRVKYMKVKADNYISEVLAGKKGAAEVFMSYGSHCLSCANTTVKTVADMAQKHEVELAALLEQLNSLPDA